MKFKLLRGRHARFEDGVLVRYAVGDVIDLSDEEARAFGVRVEKVVAPPRAKKKAKKKTKKAVAYSYSPPGVYED